MSTCTKCGAEIRWAIRLFNLSKQPLVPYDGQAGDDKRYSITGHRADGTFECDRDNAGQWMTHYANCPNARDFSKRGKR